MRDILRKPYNFLKSFYKFLFRSVTRITFRNPVKVELFYFGEHEGLVNPKEAKPVTFEGVILKDEVYSRCIGRSGGSDTVTAPWLKGMANNGKVLVGPLIRTSDGVVGFLVRSPKQDEEVTD